MGLYQYQYVIGVSADIGNIGISIRISVLDVYTNV